MVFECHIYLFCKDYDYWLIALLFYKEKNHDAIEHNPLMLVF